jgi:hypothetical protein
VFTFAGNAFEDNITMAILMQLKGVNSMRTVFPGEEFTPVEPDGGPAVEHIGGLVAQTAFEALAVPPDETHTSFGLRAEPTKLPDGETITDPDR